MNLNMCLHNDSDGCGEAVRDTKLVQSPTLIMKTKNRNFFPRELFVETASTDESVRHQGGWTDDRPEICTHIDHRELSS